MRWNRPGRRASLSARDVALETGLEPACEGRRVLRDRDLDLPVSLVSSRWRSSYSRMAFRWQTGPPTSRSPQLKLASPVETPSGVGFSVGPLKSASSSSDAAGGSFRWCKSFLYWSRACRRKASSGVWPHMFVFFAVWAPSLSHPKGLGSEDEARVQRDPSQM